MGSTYPFDGQGRQKALQAIEILEGPEVPLIRDVERIGQAMMEVEKR